jgi:hypothetical protein
MSKCSRADCYFSKHKNVTNNGGSHCCRTCKTIGGHGPYCIGYIPCPKINLADCSITYIEDPDGITDHYNFTLSWTPVPDATSYKVVWAYNSPSPVVTSGIINGNVINYKDFLTVSRSTVPVMNEMGTKNTSLTIRLNKDEGKEKKYNSWDTKFRYVFYVYSYKKTIRGKEPNTVLLLNLFDPFADLSGNIFPHASILGLLKQNVVAKKPLFEKKYRFTNLYNNKKEEKKLPDNIREDETANTFTDLNAIVCRRFTNNDGEMGSLVNTPFI